MHIQLVTDVRAVILHRPRTQTKFRGNFLAGLVFGNESENPSFRGGKPIEPRLSCPEQLGVIAPTNETPSEKIASRLKTAAATMHAMPMSLLCLTRIPLSLLRRAGDSSRILRLNSQTE